MIYLKAILFLIKKLWHYSIGAGVLSFIILWICYGSLTTDVFTYSMFIMFGTFLIASAIFGNKLK